MSQALSTIPSISSLTTRSSSSSSKFTRNNPSPCLNIHIQMSMPSQIDRPPTNPVPRRNIIAVGIGSAVLLGLNDNGENTAWAAARRPPPPPPEEKQDPNVSGVKAKILASKKRKEAMKQAMAKQREKGKIIDETSKSTITDETSKPTITEETSKSTITEETSKPKTTEETSDSSSSPSQP